MDYHRISNRLSELHWWRTVIFPSHPVSLCNRVTGNSQVPVTGWFKFFPSGFQIFLKLDFNLEMPLLDFFFNCSKEREKSFFQELINGIFWIYTVTPMKIYNLMLHFHGTCLYVHEHTSKCSLKHFFRSLKSQLFSFKEKKNPIFPQFWENNFFHTKKGFNIPLPYESLIFSETVSLAWGNYFFFHISQTLIWNKQMRNTTPHQHHTAKLLLHFS